MKLYEAGDEQTYGLTIRIKAGSEDARVYSVGVGYALSTYGVVQRVPSILSSHSTEFINLQYASQV